MYLPIIRNMINLNKTSSPGDFEVTRFYRICKRATYKVVIQGKQLSLTESLLDASIRNASATSAEFGRIRPRMYNDDLL